jgi:hypothetical protein
LALEQSPEEMTNQDIARLRLYNQHISHQRFKKPEEIVEWMGAIQAQDYAGAKWAVGLRLQKSSDAAMEKAMADGSIIRTHVLRPTWHFVAPADARWMIELTAPRINSLSASGYRRMELDSAVIKRSNDAVAKAVQGGKQLTRSEVMTALNNAGIKTNDLRFIHLLMRAEIDQVICSGGRQEKQFTYALFDDRVPMGSPFVKEEALAELARRYFISHGPATLQDFTWWSGLAPSDTKTSLEIIKPELTGSLVDGAWFWMGPDQPDLAAGAAAAYLLPAFDEFAVAYKDRTAAVNPKYLKQARNVIFDPSIVVNNQVVGTWKRAIKKNGVDINLNPFGKLNKVQEKSLENAVKRYLKFVK